MATTTELKPLLYSITQATQLLQISRNTLYGLIGSGQIGVVRIGSKAGGVRVPARALDKWIDEQTVGGKNART